MAILTRNKPPASHWYQADGTPVHRLPVKGGDGDRPTTLRDAKRLGLYPSVTSILGILNRPMLERWKLDQVALATLRSPKQPDESEEYWCTRVRDAAFEQVEQAADLGTRIHGALELAMLGQPYADDLRPYVDPVIAWKRECGFEIIEREIRLVNKAEGFAGTADVMFRFGRRGMGILDYKTRKTKPEDVVTAYDNQAMQLAAYAATYWGPENIDRVLAANIFISTTEPGRMAVVKHEHLAADWQAFRMVAELWRYLKGYDPRTVNQAEAA